MLLLVALGTGTLVALGTAVTVFRSHNEFLLYPELKSAIDSYDPRARNVLVLGGSVVDMAVGPLEKSRLDASTRFYDLAAPAHTSLDSRYKYEYLVSLGLRFDVIIFYEAINEVRANNIPSELYRDHYEHYGFYKVARKVFAERSLLALLVKRSKVAFHLYKWWLDQTQKDVMVPQEGPAFGEKLDWLRYGEQIKSAKYFRENLAAIAGLAEGQNARLIVPEFAYHLPATYTMERFRQGLLGYAERPPGFGDCCPPEIWGIPANVIKGIEVHNRVIRDLQHRFVYVPTQELRYDVANFLDICHFSPSGMTKFVNLINAVLY